MTPEKFAQMLRTPGIHVLVSPFSSFAIEVTPEGEVYQLKPQHPFQRDGVLSPDGWDPQGIANSNCWGPFSRVPE